MKLQNVVFITPCVLPPGGLGWFQAVRWIFVEIRRCCCGNFTIRWMYPGSRGFCVNSTVDVKYKAEQCDVWIEAAFVQVGAFFIVHIVLLLLWQKPTLTAYMLSSDCRNKTSGTNNSYVRCRGGSRENKIWVALIIYPVGVVCMRGKKTVFTELGITANKHQERLETL